MHERNPKSRDRELQRILTQLESLRDAYNALDFQRAREVYLQFDRLARRTEQFVIRLTDTHLARTGHPVPWSFPEKEAEYYHADIAMALRSLKDQLRRGALREEHYPDHAPARGPWRDLQALSKTRIRPALIGRDEVEVRTHSFGERGSPWNASSLERGVCLPLPAESNHLRVLPRGPGACNDSGGSSG